MLDTFALSFMVENRMINMFRNTIKKNPDMDLTTIQFVNKLPIKKNKDKILKKFLEEFRCKI